MAILTISLYTFISAYPGHGYPANSNYSSQGSWYNYPANGYPGGYSAYPGASGYWSSANGHPSHSNLSTTPQSSQAMVQYPVCPRKPPPYLVQVCPLGLESLCLDLIGLWAVSRILSTGLVVLDLLFKNIPTICGEMVNEKTYSKWWTNLEMSELLKSWYHTPQDGSSLSFCCV